MIPVSDFTIHWIETLEGCRLVAYQDAHGVWTIGYGMTTLYGRPVQQGDKISQKQADMYFGALVGGFQVHVASLINPLVLAKLKPKQLSALVSLAYNIGFGDAKTPGFSNSVVLKNLNRGDLQGAADAFLNWERVGSNKTLLKTRREAERRLFLS